MPALPDGSSFEAHLDALDLDGGSPAGTDDVTLPGQSGDGDVDDGGSDTSGKTTGADLDLPADTDTENAPQGDAREQQQTPARPAPNARDAQTARAEQQPRRGQRQSSKNHGDLIDIETGQVVAKHGTNHKDFFARNPNANVIGRGKLEAILEKATASIRPQLQQMQQREQQATARVQQLEAEVKTLRESNTVATSLKLSPEEAVYGARIAAAMKQDPVKTITYLIGEAKKAGYTVKVDGQGTDTAAIMSGIQDALRPITDAAKQQQEAQQARQAQEAEWTQFTTAYPHAAVHRELIGDLMERDPTIKSFAHAMTLIELHAARNGLDITRPLHEQQTNGSDGGTTQNGHHRNPPMPTGRTRSNGSDLQKGIPPARFDQSWDDITRDSMRRHGYNV